jgi:hypothetical protein
LKVHLQVWLQEYTTKLTRFGAAVVPTKEYKSMTQFGEVITTSVNPRYLDFNRLDPVNDDPFLTKEGLIERFARHLTGLSFPYD